MSFMLYAHQVQFPGKSLYDCIETTNILTGNATYTRSGLELCRAIKGNFTTNDSLVNTLNCFLKSMKKL